MNIARHLMLMAANQPDALAVKIPRGTGANGNIDYLSLTFAELDAEVAGWTQKLVAAGVRPGDRTLVMVRQGLPLIAVVFALFRHGAVPVIIDPGMGMKSFLRCVAHTRPRVLVGIPLARFLSHICRSAFRSIEVRIPVSGSPLARVKKSGSSTPALSTIPAGGVEPSEHSPLAAILFTSGSTGAPKGVCYEHPMFEAQVRAIRTLYNIEPGERDLSMLPVFALFAPALGMTTIVPQIDPSRPATLDPAKIVQSIQQEKITNSFGSPTLWNKIADYCIANDITLPSLRRVLCAGAPVPAGLWEKARKILPNGELHSPYGATECLPVSTISGSEVLALGEADIPAGTQEGQSRPALSPKAPGACVGQKSPEIQIKIIPISDTPIVSLADTTELAPDEIGEIVVTGPAVTRMYDTLPDATAAAKIRDASDSSRIWHRMGDTGYVDSSGRLWFCGRKVERVESETGTLYTEPVEQVFRSHPDVARAALVGIGPRGSQTPAVIIQPANKNYDRAKFTAELKALARAQPHTANITQFYFHPSFPVDVRHNAKIHRLTLAKWAASQRPSE